MNSGHRLIDGNQQWIWQPAVNLSCNAGRADGVGPRLRAEQTWPRGVRRNLPAAPIDMEPVPGDHTVLGNLQTARGGGELVGHKEDPDTRSSASWVWATGSTMSLDIDLDAATSRLPLSAESGRPTRRDGGRRRSGQRGVGTIITGVCTVCRTA